MKHSFLHIKFTLAKGVALVRGICLETCFQTKETVK